MSKEVDVLGVVESQTLGPTGLCLGAVREFKVH
jgi:hypothetical protein